MSDISENSNMNSDKSMILCESRKRAELISAMDALSMGDHSIRLDGGEDVALAFNNMADKLAERNFEQIELVASIAHDLRSPMTSVIGFVDGILNGAVKPDDREKYLKIIRSECLRLSELVSQLLDVSRIQSGDRKFNCEPFDICEKARVTLISFERRIEEKHLAVEFACEHDNIMALGDSDAIHQVLYNVCDNAVKYARDGGKYLVDLRTDENDESFIRISVYNEGIGVTCENLVNIFERYYRVNRVPGSEKSSTGLGLYISKLIVDAQGGEISAQSEYGKWFCISFTVRKSI